MLLRLNAEYKTEYYGTEYSIGLNADSEHSTKYTCYTYILNSLANNLSQVRIAQEIQGHW